jgi:hypothetical protein
MLCGKQCKIIQIISVFFFLTSCKSVEKPNFIRNEKEDDETVTQRLAHHYRLKKYQDYNFEEKFKKTVDNVYTEITEQYNVNFTYSIEPEGAVYSFSNVSVSCIADTKLSNSKKEKVCMDFLNKLDKEYDKIKGEIQ